MPRWVLALVLISGMTGCASYSRMLKSTAQFFEERAVQGCYRFEAAAGGGFGATINGEITGRFITGDLAPDLCFGQRDEN